MRFYKHEEKVVQSSLRNSHERTKDHSRDRRRKKPALRLGGRTPQKNFLTLEAKNGREGVELAVSKHPALILLDLIMPEVDGMKALKEIRKDIWGAHVPIIILTNVSGVNEQLVEDVVTHKPMNYLIKSDWKIHSVVKRIEKILETQES